MPAASGSMVDNTAHVGGLLAGLALGFTMGPRFTLVQEVDIPVGSMTVPDDAPATQVKALRPDDCNAVQEWYTIMTGTEARLCTYGGSSLVFASSNSYMIPFALMGAL